nr:hypothetical protein [Tanacetum cinerariifolium]
MSVGGSNIDFVNALDGGNPTLITLPALFWYCFEYFKSGCISNCVSDTNAEPLLQNPVVTRKSGVMTVRAKSQHASPSDGLTGGGGIGRTCRNLDEHIWGPGPATSSHRHLFASANSEPGEKS